MHHPTDRIAHTTAFVTPVVEHWVEQETVQWIFKLRLEIKSKVISVNCAGFCISLKTIGTNGLVNNVTYRIHK